MPATFLEAQEAGVAGLNPAFTAMDLVNGNSYRSASGRCLVFRNAGAGPVNVTIVTPGTSGGNVIADRVVSVPNASVPFMVSTRDEKVYRDGSGLVTFTAAGAVDVAVVQT